MKTLLILIFLHCSINIYAQVESTNWYFGNGAGLSFITNPPTPLPVGAIQTNEGCASISDPAGNLLFYSNGYRVWDSTHNEMPNSCCLYGSNTSTQSCLILPSPGNASEYYLIVAPDQFSNNPLAYSIVDKTLNGGLGDVTVKNIALLDSSTEKITAVRHHNGNDIWIIAHKFESSDFYAWLITSSGISSTPVISTIGSYLGTNTGNKVGYLKASPCGNKLANVVYYANMFDLFDFNDSTGAVTNFIQLGDWGDLTNGGVYGTEFSPDGSLLYVSVNLTGIIIQYNLLAGSAAAIIASADTIGNAGTSSGALQNGLDGKIYLAKQNVNSLDCILNPNILGDSCNFTNNYVSLAAVSRFGLPNYLTSYFCSVNTGIHPDYPNNSGFSILPNPSTDYFTVLFQNTIDEGEIEIYNSIGALVYKENIYFDLKKEIHLDNISQGIYFVKVFDGAKSYCRKLIIE